MKIENLRVFASKLELGLISPEDLPNAAVCALKIGLDSRALRMLAGLTFAEADEARALFDRALTELNISRPNTRDAVMCLVRNTAKEILRGILTPYEGAKHISELSLHLGDENSSDLDSFVYAASEWEDRPEDSRIFEDGIKAAARELVGIVPVP